ncbi:GntR family transcriptional regulator [Pseudolysinimonas sp.]|jgi:GntR family transcriptional regulator|uniref:GntR family transcriptional regulator n=1 Tax=Pseudolysinimonas sp. TaxID=2680009 RepID=UPI0037848021
MLIRIDPASGDAIFDQLAAAVRTEIGRGALRPGDRLPAARELAASLDVNIHTVLHAYQELRDEGLIDLRRGRGAIVTEQATASGELAGAIRALVADARRLGVSPSTLTALITQEFTS